MVREAKPVDRKLNPRWKRGIWLGRTTTSNENIVATEDGTVVSRTVRRLPPAARWDMQLVKCVVARLGSLRKV